MDRHYDDVVDERTFGEKAQRLWWATKEWIKGHPKESVSFVIGSLAAFGGIAKGVGRMMESHEERVRRVKSIYDRSKGHYYELKRKPTNRQWAEIDKRHDDGESYHDILIDMRLI